ncbi:hypothetical protein [Maribacter stanieri]|uniref:hypothetical protein n=1 Tax=Maribacter stanieri TaxID=440514 RepID=UPI000B812CE7|nr:hypothetical protein [Maribacter stanieri]
MAELLEITLKGALGRKGLQIIETLSYENKKGGEVSTFFAPNLTMNLTYLCYGSFKSKDG